MYDFKKIEQEILGFWRENSIFEKSLALRRAPSTRLRTSQGKKHFVFFEGPPTANGRPGIHHFMGRAFKDLFCRYKTMQGFFVLRKSGWDTHGLPVEIEVEKELGFKTKKDIEDYGVDKFNKKAKESVWKYKTEWEEMTRKMGFWLDLENPYITYENNYIESVWNIIKRIWDKKLLYLAHKVVPFCTRCGTPLSSHEVAQGYRTITDKSVIVKFEIRNPKFETNSKLKIQSSKFYILAWTTTPWTLPGNVALAIGKDIDYAIVEKDKEFFVVAKDLVEKVFGPPTYYILHTTYYKGSDLVGLEYEPLFDIKELKSKNSHKVYEADFVSTEDGTGVVHIAPMYGEDDYNLGVKFDLPRFHTVDERGRFVGISKELDGNYVKDAKTEELIINKLKVDGRLLKVDPYEHEYPFCWRCDTPLIYYAKNSWFIKTSAVKDQLFKNNQKVNWFPEHIKEGRFGQWLKEGRDWAISRERYWGTPLPVWVCQMSKSQAPNSKSQTFDSKQGCGNIKVMGSVKELEKSVLNKNKNSYYILRHGYTTRDEKGKMLISSDVKLDKYHLTTEGIKQAENNAERIKNNHKIDLIFTSPFIRTTETAEIVAKLLHLKVNSDERLREISHGGCDGKSHSKDCGAENSRRTVDDKPHELGESWNEVRARMMDFVQEVESKYTGKNILIVSHGDPLWLLSCLAGGVTSSEIEENLRKKLYPEIAGFAELNWKTIPRNEYGELDLHRPFIDSIFLKCSDCGASMKKIPDLMDVWFDSGAMPYAQWHYPFENKDMIDPPSLKLRRTSASLQQFPADFITEGMDQTRGWFYTLLAISTLLGEGNPYKNVLVTGLVLDERGKKMSKSKGNIVLPMDVMDKVGADTARWYFYTLNQPGEYKNFAMKDVEAKLKGFVFTLQNCIRFYELYSPENSKSETLNSKQYQNSKLKIQNPNPLDSWILSKFNGLLGEVTENLDKYDPTTAARAIEKFVVDDLSNWWLRRSRKRKEALELLRSLLLELAKILAPFTPFLAEDIHHRLLHNRQLPITNPSEWTFVRADYQLPKKESESVHLADWPKADKKLINKKLEEEMDEVRSIVAAGLAVRKEKQIKVRQPLAKLSLRNFQFPISNFQLTNLIKEELNVKEVVLNKDQKEEVILDTELSPALIGEGYARELIRQIQDMRKEGKYKLDQKVHGQWHSDDGEVSGAIHEWTEEIKKEALLKEFVSGPQGKKSYDIEKEFELTPQKNIRIGVRK